MVDLPNGMPADLRPEAELMLRCARTDVDPAGVARIHELLRAGIDWTELTERVEHHRVTALVYRSLRLHAAPGAVPDDVLATLRAQFRERLAKNLRLSAELQRVTALLTANGIDPVWFKGPEMAAALYGRVALRPFTDLDVLVRRRDAIAAAQLLRENGYELWDEFKVGPFTEGQLDALYSRTLKRVTSERSVYLDLHWEVTWRSLYVPLDPAGLWLRRKPVRVGRSMVHTLSDEDMFLVLVVHATKHQWEFLKLVCDVAELLRRRPGLNWGWITERAHRTGCERMFSPSR